MTQKNRAGSLKTLLAPFKKCAGQCRRQVLKWHALHSRLLSFIGPDSRSAQPNSPAAVQNLFYPGSPTEPESHLLSSGLCSEEQLSSRAFRYWTRALGKEWHLHRKLWEFCFICQALYERGMLEPAKRGLGFAVGEEPLPALFAARGCTILATDLEASDERAQAWANTSQLAVSVEKLERPDICDSRSFRERVSFTAVDMNNIPADLKNFDFTWSSCSFEHCGSIELGSMFVLNQMNCLRPGGVAVHTTEFNLSSNEKTLTEGDTVIFRKRDIDKLVGELEGEGHSVEPVHYTVGSTDADRYIDTFPYAEAPHLKLLLADRFVSTSIALIIRKRP